MLWFIPLIIILILTPFFSQIDLDLARHFFHENHFEFTSFSQFVYSYAILPGWIVVIAALLVFIYSYLRPSWKFYRPHALVLLLTMIIGVGVIVHVCLKDQWGRPRPKQLIEFGGIQEYRPFYKPNFFHQPEPSKSFPSGHAAMGFYFLAVMRIGQRLRKRWIFWGGLLTTCILGFLLSYIRIAQGGHFFSDVIFAGVIMWWTTLFFDWLIFDKYDSAYKKTA